MRRRTLDILFSAGGVGLAALLLVLGLVMANRSDFASDYVNEQLVQEDLTFPAVDRLDPREVEFTEARSGCVIANAEQAVTTGKQAECYANEYIGGHMTWLATRLGMTQIAKYDGLSYRELGVAQGDLRAKITEAADNGTSTAALEQELADLTTLRQKAFEGSMLRNALLTSYGFGSLGDTAGNVATVAFSAAGLLLLLGIAGFVHAFVTPKTKSFALPEAPIEGHRASREPVGV